MQRTATERLIQTLAFEIGGLTVAVPLYAALFGKSGGDSLILMVALSVAVLIWTPLHNAAFDRIEYRLTGRAASDRPHAIRLLHALSHEVTPIVVTLPLIMVLGGHSMAGAFSVNLGLTVVYIVYAYGFYLGYDRLFPLTVAAQSRA